MLGIRYRIPKEAAHDQKKAFWIFLLGTLLRRLNPRRLNFIIDLKPELPYLNVLIM